MSLFAQGFLAKDKQPVGRIMSRLVGDLTLDPKPTLGDRGGQPICFAWND